jgi:parallel beta-helix repeat protein
MAASSTTQKQRSGWLIFVFATIATVVAGIGHRRGLAAVSGLLAAALFGIALSAAPADAAPTCTESLQARIDAAPPGGVVTAAPCIYRERIEINKSLTLEGQEGTEIKGSDVFRSWKKRRSDGRYVSTRAVPPFPETMEDIYCLPKTNRCHWPEQVFFSGKALIQASGGKPGRNQFSLTSDRRVILGTRLDPASKTVEVSVRREWVVGTSSADDVTIDNVDMSHASNSGRTGALLNRPHQTAWDDVGLNWTVKNSTLSHAHGAVISLKNRCLRGCGPTGHNILDNRILFGGQIGVHGVASGSMISGNEIAHNNTEQYCPNASCGIGETGGIKVTHSSSVTVDGNFIHDNFGHGVHFDEDTYSNTITDNRIYGNGRMGIQYELSSDGLVARNRVIGNGYHVYETVKNPSINVLVSSNVEVADNVVSGGSTGINVGAYNREGFDSTVSGIYVHDNTIIREEGTALTWSDGNGSIAADPTNRGYSNDYWYPHEEGGSTRFEWRGRAFSMLSEFNATPGEEDGRYMSAAERDAALAE